MRLPGICLGLLTACQAASPSARPALEGPAPLFPAPRLGLHLLDDLPPDEPRRADVGERGEWLRHPWSPQASSRIPFPAPETLPLEDREPGADEAPGRTPSPIALPTRTERPEPERFSPENVPEPRDAISRFGRAYADSFDGLDKFAFRSFLDRFTPPTPGPVDPLALVPPIESDLEASVFLASRLRRVFTAPLHEGLEGAAQIEPVVEGFEVIPQEGLSAVGTVVGALSGDEEGPDLGKLRLRTRGGLLNAPSRFVSLYYKFGMLRAELYPTRAKLRIARRIGDVRVALRGEYHFTEGTPEAKFEVSRTFGKAWRFQAVAGHGVGFFSVPFFSSPPGLEETDSGIGGMALLEYRF